MTITVDQIRTWSEQLCTLPPLDVADAPRALGLAGSLVDRTDDEAVLEPPPAGAVRVGLSREHLGANQGRFGTLEVELAPGAAITRAALDRRFGAGDAGARVDADRPHVVAYRVELPGAGFRSTVFASFADEPDGAAVATKVSLRRDVVRAAR